MSESEKYLSPLSTGWDEGHNYNLRTIQTRIHLLWPVQPSTSWLENRSNELSTHLEQSAPAHHTTALTTGAWLWWIRMTVRMGDTSWGGLHVEDTGDDDTGDPWPRTQLPVLRSSSPRRDVSAAPRLRQLRASSAAAEAVAAWLRHGTPPPTASSEVGLMVRCSQRRGSKGASCEPSGPLQSRCTARCFIF